MLNVGKSLLTILLCALLLFAAVSCDQGATGEDSSGGETSESEALSGDLNSAEPEDESSTALSGTTEEEESEEPPVLNASEPSDYISYGGTIHTTMTEVIQIESHHGEDAYYRVVQGGCSDGTYFYVLLNDGRSGDKKSVSTVQKYEIATGELVATYENLLVSHGNDMTYVPDTNEIIIVHNNPEYQYISIYDADTMKLKEKKELDLKIYSIAYDPYEDCFWVGISGGYKFAKMNRKFKRSGKIYEGVETGYTRQGLGVDSKYLYFIQYKTNSIVVYDKSGEFVRIIVLPKTNNEPENISCIGDYFYIAFGKGTGGAVYKTELSVLASATIEVDMKEYVTLPRHEVQVEDDTETYHSATGCCSDGTYLYLTMNSALNSMIYKIDLQSGAIVEKKEGYALGCTGDMTYNPDKKQIVVAHNDSSSKLTVLDAETLDVLETKTLDFEIASIAYDDKNDCYWAGNALSNEIRRLDTSFASTFTFEIYDTGYSQQGIECDGEYIYCIQNSINVVAIYRTNGRFVGYEALPKQKTGTARSICLVDNTFYVSYNVSNAGGLVYRTTIEIKK